MRTVLYFSALAVLFGPLVAAPPDAGGFMVGRDSSLYIYWFHSGVHLYEQGIDHSQPELNLAPGDLSGRYSIVQKSSFPYLSYIDEYTVKIFRGDDFPTLPGDHFSPFGYSVYIDGFDSMPSQPPVISGNNSLCDAIPCSEEWAVNRVALLNLSGEKLWFGFDWADSTPSAPEIRSIILPGAEKFNRLGVKAGQYYQWSNLAYAPIFRNRFMTLCDIDDSVTTGWRHRLEEEDRPDSFLITCYGLNSKPDVHCFFNKNDTLVYRLPYGNIDSISIRSCYGSTIDDSGLVIRYDPDMIPPIAVETVNGNDRCLPYQFELIIENRDSDSIHVVLGYDKKWKCDNGGRMAIAGHTYSTSAFELPAVETDSSQFLFLIQEESREYYPYLVSIPYPPPEPTAVETDHDLHVVPKDQILIYPNPTTNNVTVKLNVLTREARLDIYNVIGQKVWAGSFNGADRLVWDGRDGRGRRLPQGIYFMRIIDPAGDIYTRKIVLLR